MDQSAPAPPPVAPPPPAPKAPPPPAPKAPPPPAPKAPPPPGPPPPPRAPKAPSAPTPPLPPPPGASKGLPKSIPVKPAGLLSGIGSGASGLRKTKSVAEQEAEKRERELARMNVPTSITIPTWLNLHQGTPPLTECSDWIGAIFKGDPSAQCVLLDFFAYSCTNCLRTLPVLTAWHHKYSPYGLRVVGMHRPEFEFEKDPSRLSRFLARWEITYPVGLDNEGLAWGAWEVDSWPTHILIPRPLNTTSHQPVVIRRDPEIHVGDRGHDVLERRLLDHLIARQPQEAPLIQLKEQVAAVNREVFYDMEFFLGTGHRVKNLASSSMGPACEDGVCRLPPRSGAEEVAGGTTQTGGSIHNGGGMKLVYSRAPHSGLVELGEGWVEDADGERIISAEIGGNFSLQFHLKAEEELQYQKVSVFMVAGPHGSNTVNLTVECAGLETRNIVMEDHNRHLLGVFSTSSTLQVNASGHLEMFTFYITTQIS